MIPPRPVIYLLTNLSRQVLTKNRYRWCALYPIESSGCLITRAHQLVLMFLDTILNIPTRMEGPQEECELPVIQLSVYPQAHPNEVNAQNKNSPFDTVRCTRPLHRDTALE